jgi:hypothetical protein
VRQGPHGDGAVTLDSARLTTSPRFRAAVRLTRVNRADQAPDLVRPQPVTAPAGSLVARSSGAAACCRRPSHRSRANTMGRAT